MSNSLAEQLKMISGAPHPEQSDQMERMILICKKVLLPISVLLGVQGPHEYVYSKENAVTNAYRKHGTMTVLKNFPPIICEVFQPNTGVSTFFIVDGHHRIRYAPRFGVRTIPCLVISSIELARILGFNHDSLCEDYFNLAARAMSDFHRVMGIKQKRPPSKAVCFHDGKSFFKRTNDSAEFLDLENIGHTIVDST